jgi:hypothetical protein
MHLAALSRITTCCSPSTMTVGPSTPFSYCCPTNCHSITPPMCNPQSPMTELSIRCQHMIPSHLKWGCSHTNRAGSGVNPRFCTMTNGSHPGGPPSIHDPLDRLPRSISQSGMSAAGPIGTSASGLVTLQQHIPKLSIVVSGR